jgi:hypothetical protein
MVLIAAKRSKADVCLFYQWTAVGLLVYLSWVDDILIAGNKEDVLRAKWALARHFTVDEQGEMMVYVGCQIEHDRKKRWMKMTQPVMIQSFEDEFGLPDEAPQLPAPPGEVLTCTAGESLDEKKSSKYSSGTGKLMHMMKWTRYQILNRVRKLSRFMAAPTSLHMKRMYRMMNYVRHTAKFPNYIKPSLIWDGLNRNMEFVISGCSDAEYAPDPETRRSVSGGTVLSVTKAEFVAAVEVVQNMLFAWRVLVSLGLKVKLPMVIEVDNKGAVDLAYSWTATGRTRHIATRINFLRELKEQGLISINWISNVGMSSDIFTKNVGGKDLYKHRDVYVREDPSVP